MTEPGAGSDLQGVRTVARRDGEHYVLSGSKIFITNGQNAQGVIVVCKTDPTQGAKGTSLLFVEVEDAQGNLTPGFSRGRNLDKIGMHGQDTSELFFDGVRVPVESLIGGVEGQGFFQLMNELPQERLLIAVQAMGGMERGLAEALKYTQERQAFGKRIWELLGEKKSVEVVFEHVGQRTFPASVWLAAKHGRVVICGATTGYDLTFDVRHLWMSQKRIIGSHFADADSSRRANKLVEQGLVKPVMTECFDWDQLQEAHQRMYDNQVHGTVSILVGAPRRGLKNLDETRAVLAG